MATGTKERPTAWYSGFCGVRLPEESHRRCIGSHGDLTCACSCHAPAPVPDPDPVEHQAAPALGPGVHQLAEEDYFAHPALSCSGAKRLLPPSCPAVFRHEQLHGRPNKATFDMGHAAHKAVLGVGAPLQLVKAADWRTKKAQEQRNDAYTTGAIPLLAKDWEQVQEMAAAIRRHRIASALFDPERGGKPEQSLIRTDEQTGVLLRSRLDWLPPVVDGRMVIGDYKTTAKPLTRASLGKAMADYRYDMQAAFYADMVLGLGLAERVAFVFVFQQKDAPYLISIAEPDAEALDLGRRHVRRAIDIYAECLEADTWPGYSDDVELISLPKRASYDFEDMLL